jgi:AMP deaminase
VQLNPHRDWYNARKIDNHVHHSACMNERHLLSFIKTKLATEPDTPVGEVDGENVTLRELFERLSLNAYNLSIDTLDSM